MPAKKSARATSVTEATRPFTTAAVQPDDIAFDVPTLPPSIGEQRDQPMPALPAFEAPSPARTEPEPGTLDFDFGGVSLDLDAPPPAPSAMPRVDSSFVDFDLPEEPESAEVEDADPLARKLDLADEFRQIGDLEGARDLLEEVVAKADGGLRGKAQTMLDNLA